MTTQATLEQALESWPQWETTKAIICETFNAGFSNTSYKLACGQRSYLLRIVGPSCIGMDRRREALLLAELEVLKLSPKRVFSDAQGKFIISEFIEAHTLSISLSNSRQTILQLAKLLTDIHVAPIKSLHQHLNNLDLKRHCDVYWQALEASQTSSLANDLHQCRQKIKPNFKLIQENTRAFCLCHHDLVPENILQTNPLMAIDWEFSSLGNPLFDIAGVVEASGFTTQQVEELLKAYNAQNTLVSQNAVTSLELHPFRLVYRYLYILWAMLYQPSLHERAQSTLNDLLAEF